MSKPTNMLHDNSNRFSTSQCSEVTSALEISDPKTWGAVTQWTDSMWTQFLALHEAGDSGEELMKKLSLKRRKELELIYYKLSHRQKQFFEIKWEEDYENNGRRLPDLKMSKAGLTISPKRFERLGLNIPLNTYFILEKVDDKELRLLIDI